MSNIGSGQKEQRESADTQIFQKSNVKVTPINQDLDEMVSQSGEANAGNQQDVRSPDKIDGQHLSPKAQDSSAEKKRAGFKKKSLSIAQQLDRNHFAVYDIHIYDPKEKTEHKFAKSSLFCLSSTNKLRYAFVWLATWNIFEFFITLAIVLNSFLLASTDYQKRLDPTYVSEWTPNQEKIDYVFSWIFIVECFVKVVAMGFVLNKGSYLRDSWNKLDFFIVSISIIGMLPFSSGNDSLKALRTFRILRPLRSINKMPTMKTQINSLLDSIPGLMRVFFFIMFIFTIFAIFGANQFMGQQYQFCRSQTTAEYDVDGNFVSWPKSGEADGEMVLCREDDQCKKAFPDDDVAICGAVMIEFGMDPIEYDDIREIELIMYGIPGFDNVGQGFLTIFQILTLESWVYLMYNFSDAGNAVISVIFFVLIVLLGAFFTMNLVLAIIVDSFDASKDDTDDGDAEAQKKKVEEELSKDPKLAAAVKGKKVAQQEEEKQEKQEKVEIEMPALRLEEIPEAVVPISRNNVAREESGSLLPSITGTRSAGIAARNIAQAERAADENAQSQRSSEPDQPQRPDDSPDKLDVENGRESPQKEAESSKGERGTEVPHSKLEHQEQDAALQQKVIAKPKDDLPLVLQEDDEEYFFGFEEEEYERDARNRATRNGCYLCFYSIVTSVAFNFFIFMLIIGNTVTLAAFTYNQSDLQTQVLEIFNEFFTWVFLLEMIMKLIGLGFSNYKQDKYNLFDAVIVIISLIDWTLSRIPNVDTGSALNAFRALRLLRMMKLSKSWKALAEILRKTAKSLVDISNFSLILMLFMYIFALLGMELFANGALVDKDDNLIAGEEEIQALYASGDYYTFPRDNFNNVGYALTTIFILIIGEDWNWTMYQWARAYGYGSAVSYWIAIFFFLILMILGNIVLFSLFTAILLDNFEGGDEDEEEDEESDPTVSKRFSKEGCSKMCESFKEAFGKKKRKLMPIAEGEDSNNLNDESKIKNEEAFLKSRTHSRSVQDGLVGDSEMMFDQAQIDQELRSKARMKRGKQNAITPLFHYKPMETMFAAVQSLKQSQIEEDLEPVKPLMGNALFCLGPNNCFRRGIHKFVEYKWFKRIILLLIIISTLTLAAETPLDNPDGDKVQILSKIDFAMTIIFTFEAAVTIIAYGFLFAGKYSYIRDPWNVLDFLIVVSALLGVIAGDSIDIAFIKALRILKILRPLRLIARDKNLKVAITALGRSIPNIVRLQVIVLFFVFLFAILQTTLFSGQFYSCNTDHLDLSIKQKLQNIGTMWDCINYGGEWRQPDLNFDTTMNSMLTLVTIQTTEGWIDVLWNAVDAVAPYRSPKENYNPIMIIYMMFLILIVAMLFVELFVGVVIETFNSQKELMQGNRDLSRMQISYARVHMLIVQAKPKKRLTAQFSALRNAMINFTEHRAFDQFIMFAIMANTFILGFVWYGQSQEIKDVLEVLNYIFMVIFTIEAIFKIIAQHCDYFKDSWNLFDFTVVAATIVILAVTWADLVQNLDMVSTILRTLRIGRVFRLIKKQEKLQEIFKTLISALPSMLSLGILLMLLIFMFAIIGMAQFALVDLNGASEMNQHVNFQDFGTAFLTLVRCSTGEAWNSIMLDSAQSFNIVYQCNENESYKTMIADGRDPTETFDTRGCGKPGIAIAFHLLFQVIVSQVFLNLFIAIIIDAFFGQTDMANMPVKEKTVEDFAKYWSYYDLNATGKITVEQLNLLLIDLAGAHPEEGGSLIPFKKRTADIDTGVEFRQRQIAILKIPTYNKMTEVLFWDVLIKLSFQAVKLYFQKADIKQMQHQLKVIRSIGGGLFNDDTLEVLHSNNVNKAQFDQEFSELLTKMNEPSPKAEILMELKIENKKLKAAHNQKVDTDVKILQSPDDENILVQRMEKGMDVDVELYTTEHIVATKRIMDFVLKHHKDRGTNIEGNNGSANNGLNSINQPLHVIAVASSIDVPYVRAPPPQSNIDLLPSGGVTELDPDANQPDSAAMPDEDWRNMR